MEYIKLSKKGCCNFTGSIQLNDELVEKINKELEKTVFISVTAESIENIIRYPNIYSTEYKECIYGIMDKLIGYRPEVNEEWNNVEPLSYTLEIANDYYPSKPYKNISDKDFYDEPTQVKYWDDCDERYIGGIAFKNYLICGCCGGVRLIKDIKAKAIETGIANPIIDLPWVNIHNEIMGW